MKNYILIFTSLFFASISLMAQQYDAQNIDFKSNWKDESFDHTTMETFYNSIWGWHDHSKRREYGILGGKDGTYFIEVTNPENPVFRAYVKGKQSNCIWREFKTYKNYAYLISDDAPPNSFQIVDMSYLPDSVHVVHDSNEIFETAHTLYIDGDKLYCAHVRKKDGTYYSMAVYSLADPKNPVLLRALSDDYPEIDQVHDMFVRNDTVYASTGFQGLHIFKF
nr:choice-of-anchor B family protein [Bacteroidota bacterium]